MTGFSKEIAVGNKVLDFKFSLIHTMNSKRYFVVVNENDTITSFYLHMGPGGKWQLADRFKVVPGWVYAIEADLQETIHLHEQAQEVPQANP